MAPHTLKNKAWIMKDKIEFAKLFLIWYINTSYYPVNKDSDLKFTTHMGPNKTIDDLVEEFHNPYKLSFKKCYDCGTEYYSNERCPECNPMG